jgi:hypothetical protein
MQNNQQTTPVLFSIIAYNAGDSTIEMVTVATRPLSVIVSSLQPESPKVAGNTLQEELTVSQKLRGNRNYHCFMS